MSHSQNPVPEAARTSSRRSSLRSMTSAIEATSASDVSSRSRDEPTEPMSNETAVPPSA